MRTILLCLTAAFGAAIVAPNAADAQRRSDYRSSVDTTVSLERGGLIELTHINGDISVTTWDRDDVRVVAYAEHAPIITEFTRRRVAVRIETARERGGQSTRRGDWIGESRFELTVPRGVRVVAITVSGDVTVIGTGGEVSVRSVNGDVTVEDARGSVEVASVSGDARLRRGEGRITVSSVGGDVQIANGTGDVRASTVSGDVLMSDMRASSVEASTTSGDVSYSGPVDPRGRYDLTTHSGDVVLRIPADSRATVTASTFSGDIDTNFPITLAPAGTSRQRGSTLEFPLGGGGGATIAVRTFSGDVILRRPR